MAVVRAHQRAHRQARDGRLQHHRRDRRDAPPRRPGGARRRLLRHGQPELVRLLGRADAAPPHRRWPCTATATATARLSRHPLLGMSFQAYQTLWRLAGVDHMHVHGLQGKFSQADDEVWRRRATAWPPLTDGADDRVMPAFSSGQWAGTVPATWAAMHSDDLLFMSGGGILAHPDGAGGRRGQHAARPGTRRAQGETAGRSAPRTRPSCAARSTFFGTTT